MDQLTSIHNTVQGFASLEVTIRYFELCREVDNLGNWRTRGFRKFVKREFKGYTCREIAGYWAQHSQEASAGWLDLDYYNESSVMEIQMMIDRANEYPDDVFEVIHTPKQLDGFVRMLSCALLKY